MKLLLILFATYASCFGSTLYFKDGNSLDAKILDANETHVRIARDEDLQQFRFRIDALTIDTQKQIELYHSEDRYSSIPTSPIPLDDKVLRNYSSYIDQLIDDNLRSKKLHKTKPIDDYTLSLIHI